MAGDFDWGKLFAGVSAWTKNLQGMMDKMSTSSARHMGGIAITMMLQMELQMNTLSQFTMGVTNMMASKNSMMSQICQNIK